MSWPQLHDRYQIILRDPPWKACLYLDHSPRTGPFGVSKDYRIYCHGYMERSPVPGCPRFCIALRYSTVVGLAMLDVKTPASIAFWIWITAYSFYPEGAHSELLERSHGFLMCCFVLAS